MLMPSSITRRSMNSCVMTGRVIFSLDAPRRESWNF
jgi:hypothetical protein